MNFLISLIAALGITIASWFVPHPQTLSPQMKTAMQQYLADSQVDYGATQPFAGQTYNLAGSGVSSSASTITLTSLTLKQTGQPIHTSDLVGTKGTFYVTIEPGSNTKQEIVGCTGVTQSGSSASLTGCTRGLSPMYPYTASTTLQFTHAGGSQVIFSDPPQLFNQYYALANVATSTNYLVFSSTTPPHYDINLTDTMWNNATGTTLVDLAKLNATAIAGALNATQSVKGIIQLATSAQAASSTVSGSTGANLVIPTSIATDTPQAKCNTSGSAAGAGCSIIADLGGHVKQAWLNLTQYFKFSNLQSASTTLTGTVHLGGIGYTFPSTQTASDTVLTTNGSGSLSWNQLPLGITSTSTTIRNSSTAPNSVTKTVYCVSPKKAISYSYSGVAGLSDVSGNYWSQDITQASTTAGLTGVTFTLTCSGAASESCNNTVTISAICVNP